MRCFPRFPMALLAAALCAASPALAQSDPTAGDILDSLTPRESGLGATRGIKLAPAMPGAPESIRAKQAVAADASPSVSLMVQFANGSAELTPAAIRILDRLGQALTNPALAGARFRIEGHTDTVGTNDYNAMLSQQRAAAVVAYLAGKFGVDAARLDPVGLGAEKLLVPTPDQTPEPRNRRVRVVNLSA